MDRMTYFEHGKNRLTFEGTEYSNAFVDRLASYEDTNLAPEEIESAFSEKTVIDGAEKLLGVKVDRLHVLADADRDGRVVVLPCKVGDTVYRIVNDAEPHITKDLVCEIRVSASVTLVISLIGDRIICEDDFGKIVFPSYQEAEAALEKEAGNG